MLQRPPTAKRAAASDRQRRWRARHRTGQVVRLKAVGSFHSQAASWAIALWGKVANDHFKAGAFWLSNGWRRDVRYWG